jgi:hypothetical protein
MNGEAHWLDAALMIAGGGAILAYIWFAARSKSFLLRDRERFVCPVTRLIVDATLVEDVRLGELTDVRRCSGWRHPWAPCAKMCLQPLNRGELIAPPHRR